MFSFSFFEFQIEVQVLARMKVRQCHTPLIRNPIYRLLHVKVGKLKSNEGDKVVFLFVWLVFFTERKR